MPKLTAEQLRKYAADPMQFFKAVRLVSDGKAFGELMTPDQRDLLQTIAPCLLAVARRQRPPVRGVWLEAVKGFGKDSLAGLSILWLLLFSPWPVLVQVGADDQQQGGELKRAIEDWISANPWVRERVEVQRWRVVNGTTGSVCEVLTADAASSHGARPNLVCVNEVSHITSEDFAATLLDNFTKMPDAFALLCTNAGYLSTWAWRWREQYRQDCRWHFVKVTTTPAWQSQADIEEARRRNPPARFRRLYQGEWVSPGGDSLPVATIEKAICLPGPVPRERMDLVAGIGVDVGLQCHHAAVVVVLGDPMRGKLRVAKVVDMPPPVFLEEVRDCILRLARQYNVNAVCMDPWQALRIAEELRARGLFVLAQQQSGQLLTKQAGALLQALNDGILELPDDPILLNDLFNARVVEKSYGHRVELAENEHGHGDRLSALLQVLPSMLEALGSVPAELLQAAVAQAANAQARAASPISGYHHGIPIYSSWSLVG